MAAIPDASGVLAAWPQRLKGSIMDPASREIVITSGEGVETGRTPSGQYHSVKRSPRNFPPKSYVY